VLAAALVGAACSPAAPSAQPAAGSAPAAVPAQSGTTQAPADWAAIVEAAKKEGVVVCGCPPRPDFTRVIKEGFEAAHPELRLEATAAPLPEFFVRVEKEQEAGQYLWDVYAFGATLEMFALKNKGGLAPTREYLVGPDVGTDADWEGGLDARFMDREKKYIFTFWRNVQNQVSINRDVLPTTQIHSFEDLLDPALKGKMVWQDPRIGGSGINFFAAVYQRYGREGARQILVDQEPLLLKGNSEVAEQHIRGTRPLSTNRMSPDAMIPYRDAGVRLNLDLARPEDLAIISTVGNAPTVLRNPPHPNATKVFLNWIASRAGQEYLSETLTNNSARKGVAPGDPQAVPQPGREYFEVHQEENMTGIMQEAQRVARELVP
jgi:ABC-type Fe3+ transport system substrate-binding protein